MTFGSENVQSLTVVIDSDPGGDAEIFYAMKAAREMTVLSAYMTSEQTQNAGTAVKLTLETWGTAGTAVEGTVVAAVGGTAVGSRLTARTPSAGVVDTAEDYLAEGEWLVLRYSEEGSGWISGDRFTYNVHYVLGLGA